MTKPSEIPQVDLELETTRIGALMNKQEQFLLDQYKLFINRAASPINTKRMEKYLEANNIEGILKQFDIYIEQFGNALSEAFLNTARIEGEQLTERFGLLLKAKPNSINLADDRLMTPAKRNRANLIKNLSRQQRSLIRAVLIGNIRAHRTIEEIIEEVKNHIGLTYDQAKVLDSYRTSLNQREEMAALDKNLLDGGYDGMVKGAPIEKLTPKQINRMVSAYSYVLQLARASVIAATESLKLVNQARMLATNLFAELAGLDTKRRVKTWIRTTSAEPRENHLDLAGTTIPADEPFVSPNGVRFMFPGDTSLGAPLSEIIQCKCGVRYDFE